MALISKRKLNRPRTVNPRNVRSPVLSVPRLTLVAVFLSGWDSKSVLHNLSLDYINQGAGGWLDHITQEDSEGWIYYNMIDRLVCFINANLSMIEKNGFTTELKLIPTRPSMPLNVFPVKPLVKKVAKKKAAKSKVSRKPTKKALKRPVKKPVKKPVKRPARRR